MTSRGYLACAAVLLVTAGCILVLDHADEADADPTDSGQCGINVFWSYYQDQKKLIIEGSGNMYDYSPDDDRWGNHLDTSGSQITVEIHGGVESIGEYAFANCLGLCAIDISNGLTAIEDHAFLNCGCLSTVSIPDSVTSIEGCAFYGCMALTAITIPYSVSDIGEDAFGNLKFHDTNGNLLENEAADLRGHYFTWYDDGELKAVAPTAVTITFNGNGGDSSTPSLTTSGDGKLDQLPTAH